jgi:hypothetical protein
VGVDGPAEHRADHQQPADAELAQPVEPAPGDHQTDADEGEQREPEQHRTGADAVPDPADQLGDQRGGGGEEGDLLRGGVPERQVGQHVEPGEAEHAERHHLDGPAAGTQGGQALPGQQQGEQDRGREDVPGGGEVQRVDPGQGAGQDGEHDTPAEHREEREGRVTRAHQSSYVRVSSNQRHRL